tara:strand:- start:216 stop:1178 length:963 start_codon:yes stop_codon:yes gene_type:complete
MNIIQKIINKISRMTSKEDANELKILMAQSLVRDNIRSHFEKINDAEFKVFSQWGEDGIIQYLINKIPIQNKVFIEFGVQNYKEANTRFLLENNNWSGLVMDGSAKNIEDIKKSDLYWKYDLVAKEIFITKDNIDEVIKSYIDSSGYKKNIGLLSIDIDGNDYYVWDAIKNIDPIIVICEYNWIFGNKLCTSVPYDSGFIRTQKHHSNLYFGSSIQALCKLAHSKGYEYIGCTRAGNDAFFVKKDYAQKYIKELITTPTEIFSEQKAKESRDENGKLTFIRGVERFEVIRNMDVLDLETNKIVTLDTLFSDRRKLDNEHR